MIHIYKGLGHLLKKTRTDKEFENENAFKFTESSLNIFKTIPIQLEKFGIIEIPEEIIESVNQYKNPSLITVEKYYEYPFSTLFANNDYNTTEKQLLENAEEAYRKGFEILCTPVTGAIFIESQYKKGKLITELDSRIDLISIPDSYSRYKCKDFSPEAFNILMKLFSFFYSKKYFSKSAHTFITNLQKKLDSVEFCDIKNIKETYSLKFDSFDFDRLLIIINSVEEKALEEWNKSQNKPFPNINIFNKIYESIKNFQYTINKENEFFKIGGYLAVSPVESRKEIKEGFEKIMKETVLPYKNRNKKPLDVLEPEVFTLNQDKLQIALLIDCDNASAKAVSGVINELSKYGIVNIRKAYGNWKSPLMKSWETKLHENVIIPVQQFAYTKGKNATDIAMAIDSMEILYTNNVKAFAFMTSDSDFTPLISKLIYNGMTVFGFGEKKTPLPFIHACSQFIYTENLEKDEESEKKPDFNKNKVTDLRNDKPLIKLLSNAIEQTSDDNGWSHVAAVGLYLNNNSSFSPINYGYQKLGQLLKAIDIFEIQMQGLTMYVRIEE